MTLERFRLGSQACEFCEEFQISADFSRFVTADAFSFRILKVKKIRQEWVIEL
jgi:hypothetical protein